MPKEYEYLFQDFDKLKIISKLKELKAIYKGTYLFRVQQLNMPEKENLKNSRIRIRDEGFRITMTIKTKTKTNDFDEEKEIIIDNFETGIDMLLILGCEKDAYHEKIREIWTIKNTEIVFDIGPGYPEVMEIESKTLGELKNMVKLFNLIVIPKNERKNLFVELFGIDMKEIYKIKNITFINAKKILTPLVSKNKKKFNLLIKEQKNIFKKIIKS